MKILFKLFLPVTLALPVSVFSSDESTCLRYLQNSVPACVSGNKYHSGYRLQINNMGKFYRECVVNNIIGWIPTLHFEPERIGAG